MLSLQLTILGLELGVLLDNFLEQGDDTRLRPNVVLDYRFKSFHYIGW
jgi:hypothetical protein